MERLKELITQLKEQSDRKAEPAQMLETVHLLEAELQQLASQPQPVRVMPTKITVMMPSATKMYAGQQNGQVPAEPKKEPANQRNNNVNGAPPVPVSEEDTRYMPPTTPAPAPAVQPSVPAPIAAQEAPATATLEKPLDRGQWPFNPLADKPTDRFTLSQRSREVNDVIGLASTSLNDKLKSEVADLKSALNDTPVRDLKKAIGVNDRYVFINQLFRGDEVMYERSIKTINGFRILPEAEYWMERELKVKLGWDENRETTRHFYQLVKRRFS
ncbi:MAG TPA: hypothetical protein VHE34_29655 [Puia sp.]|uniref:hypothetical protein n=1 Tax=Puia sp. TaxID=2045100 RepID=UPI002B57B53D|nr:hypothetical protein [Puia sp.]HVU99438.1 hypothetical protein [Puia sp.]